ncbi:sulfate transporter [Penicillium bovifimosum]|uniref:Sulfate transporter n=1 Tax=Penicillium bovifimosum TaxID=126998 RepID=A0A9W9L694_9EURO|nr:sulfate transporter [Penicillium bovifimosum]KAJ5138645.1 sulfate transporter [Penicillium bovifimosum]
MGVLQPRGRRDSRASALSRNLMSDRDIQGNAPSESLVEQANLGSSPGPMGAEASSYNGSTTRTPNRSFYHRSFNSNMDTAHYASDGLRDQTAELATYGLSLNKKSLLRDGSGLPPSLDIFNGSQSSAGQPRDEATSSQTALAKASFEPEHASVGAASPSASSALTEMIRRPLSGTVEDQVKQPGEEVPFPPPPTNYIVPEEDTERTLLLSKARSKSTQHYGTAGDAESQRMAVTRSPNIITKGISSVAHYTRTLSNPKSWDKRVIWREAVVYPASLVPAVLLGLLLNILDALSYGMILFPLGEPLFAHLGTDGISMFYVSTIISQVVFSCGGSIFKGGIGSEMIEVVPFFHQMAFTIMNSIGKDNPESVIATTILAFSVSSILTGLVFFLMGVCGLGSLIGFFPRHILIGCIGGVGYFLLQTGMEVSARLPGSLEYNIPTIKKLFHLDTFPLWIVPLSLAIGLLILKRFVRSNFLVGGYFIAVAVVFYIVVLSAGIPMDALRHNGWVFDAPSSNNPWYHFYTLYDLSAVNWTAFSETIPAMFALTFFGVLHVPINVPALGISTGEDNLNVDRELVAHGVTNALSGFAGSIQNYLVYTNSLLFIASGGSSRLAGLMLAAATAGIMVIGPVIIGYIPIMVVGALIFLLGIELLQEALADTWGKLTRLEYLTVVIIVVTMGAWDFVVGIFVGIILACVNFVVQTSRKSAIRATYSGEVAGSTVRRPPIQQQFLREAGQQTKIMKLAGYLFFGTIVNVENTMRGLIEEEAFDQRPIRFLILDFSRVYGLDFSAAEAFTRINRVLQKRNVQIVISGLNIEGDVGKSLHNVGLFESESAVPIFEDLNSALEFCENDYLKVFYSRQEALSTPIDPTANSPPLQSPTPLPLPVPSGPQSSPLADSIVSSPRRQHLQRVATSTIQAHETTMMATPAWSAMRQPLPLLLQTFQGLSTQNEDFWFPACPYFCREYYPAGTVLYHEGDAPRAFYLLESGMLRAGYDLPQGRYFELIVAGRPCGELPFFSDTRRTATVKAERDCVAWCLTGEQWKVMQEKEPRIARELLTVSLKLTTERMDSITSYVLTMAA